MSGDEVQLTGMPFVVGGDWQPIGTDRQGWGMAYGGEGAAVEFLKGSTQAACVCAVNEPELVGIGFGVCDGR